MMDTERLYLREWTSELLAHASQMPLEDQAVFFGMDSRGQLERELNKYKKRVENKHIGIRKWDIVLKKGGNAIGSCGFHNWHLEHSRAELGYILHEHHRGMGYMGEALSLLISYGFQEMGLNRIEAFISPENSRSIKIVEYFGFELEGILREHYQSKDRLHDSICYSLLKREWKIRL